MSKNLIQKFALQFCQHQSSFVETFEKMHWSTSMLRLSHVFWPFHIGAFSSKLVQFDSFQNTQNAKIEAWRETLQIFNEIFHMYWFGNFKSNYDFADCFYLYNFKRYKLYKLLKNLSSVQWLYALLLSLESEKTLKEEYVLKSNQDLNFRSHPILFFSHWFSIVLEKKNMIY